MRDAEMRDEKMQNAEVQDAQMQASGSPIPCKLRATLPRTLRRA